jgi:hypothetical protein
MLSNTLDTNEVKNASGTEVEFTHLKSSDRSRTFAIIGESPSLPQRLSISHLEVGAALRKRRRSVVRFDITSVSDVDEVTPVTCSAYTVVDYPVGAQLTNANMQLVLAYLQSFLASDGSDTAIKYDCTGSGAAALLNGSL